MDTMEDSTYQGRTFLGLADQACNYRRVRVTTNRRFATTNSFFSLPGTPLWIAFTFSRLDGIYDINQYFPPAGW